MKTLLVVTMFAIPGTAMSGASDSTPSVDSAVEGSIGTDPVFLARINKKAGK